EMGRAGFSYAKATHDIDTVMPRFKELLSGVVRHDAERGWGR
ncbi:MAG: hypothetical protein XD74_1995, partial [Actinobacteria bacterium 66_15]